MKKLIKPIDIYKQEDGEAYLIIFKIEKEEACTIEIFFDFHNIKYAYIDSGYQLTAKDYHELKTVMNVLNLCKIL